jgi:cytidylate kinase
MTKKPLIMENSLIQILVRSFESKDNQVKEQKEPGPFITISREYGCRAGLLSEMIISQIAQKGYAWQVVNKEILCHAANELKMHPEKVRSVISDKNRGVLDEIIDATTSKYYKSDRKIRQTISNAVSSFARQGNVIIIGRGGASITQGLSNGLHIRLVAPSLWRLESLMTRHQLNREEALKRMTSFDHKRYKLQRDYLKGMQDLDLLFDVKFNCSKVSLSEISKMIIQLMEIRGMIQA